MTSIPPPAGPGRGPGLDPAPHARAHGIQRPSGTPQRSRALPSRFAGRLVPPGGNQVVIADTQTGRETMVPLYAYFQVSAAFAGLFGDDGHE